MKETKGEIKTVAVADLQPWEENYRQHPQAQLERIAESLERNGQRKAVVVQADTMRIIAGHGVVEAAQKLGWESLRCDVWDCSDDQARAYLVDDNELSRHAVDDDAALAELLTELQDTEWQPAAFDNDEVQQFLYDSGVEVPDFQPVGMDEQGKLDEKQKEQLKCPECGYEWYE